MAWLGTLYYLSTTKDRTTHTQTNAHTNTAGNDDKKGWPLAVHHYPVASGSLGARRVA